MECSLIADNIAKYHLLPRDSSDNLSHFSLEENFKVLFGTHYFIKIVEDLDHQNFLTKPGNLDILMAYSFSTPFYFSLFFFQW